MNTDDSVLNTAKVLIKGMFSYVTDWENGYTHKRHYAVPRCRGLSSISNQIRLTVSLSLAQQSLSVGHSLTLRQSLSLTTNKRTARPHHTQTLYF